jgi:hypothetical protein
MAASIEEVAIELGRAVGITVLGGIRAGVYSAIPVRPSRAVLPLAVRKGIEPWRERQRLTSLAS